MAMQIEQSKLKETSSFSKPIVWIDEFGRLETSAFDLSTKSYQGRIYRLTPEEGKVIAETVGFTARFDNTNIRAAYVDISNRAGVITTEITKNTKPNDIGLRYTADRWAPVERSKNGDSLRPWLKSQFQARLLPDKILIALAELLKLKIEDRDLFYIRVNFKDQTYSLIADKDHVEKFPAKAFSIFSLGQDEVAFVNSSDPTAYNDNQGKRNNMTETNNEPNQETTQALPTAEPSAPGTKYATYSMSEIDQLLRQQAEVLTNLLNSKVTNQQKMLQETMKTQEKTIAKIVDELHAYGDSVRKRVEAAETQQKDVVQTLAEQSKSGLISEIEQFKSYVTKSVTPNIKVLDERVKTIISEYMEKSKPKENKFSYGLMLTVLALVISIVDLVLVLYKHRIL